MRLSCRKPRAIQDRLKDFSAGKNTGEPTLASCPNTTDCQPHTQTQRGTQHAQPSSHSIYSEDRIIAGSSWGYKFVMSQPAKKQDVNLDERSPELKGDFEAQLDDLGDDPGQVGRDSAGQSGDVQGLSHIADASDESVEELAEEDQALEASVIEGAEDAADHPERPVHTHQDYGHPEDVPARNRKDEAA